MTHLTLMSDLHIALVESLMAVGDGAAEETTLSVTDDVGAPAPQQPDPDLIAWDDSDLPNGEAA